MGRDVYRYIICLWILALLIWAVLPVYMFHGTVTAEPMERKPDAMEYTTASTLSEDCQQIARHVADGNTVYEEGYQLKLGTTILLKRTNITDSWYRGDSFCAPQIYSSGILRIDGQYYNIGIRFHRGKVSWIGTMVPVLFMAGVVFSLLELRVGR